MAKQSKEQKAEGIIWKTDRDGKRYPYARIQWIENGKARSKYKKARNITHAKQLRQQLLADLRGHGSAILDSEKMTFAELAERYKESCLVPASYAGNVKISGQRSWENQRGFLTPLIEHFGTRYISTITYEDLAQYRKKRFETPTRLLQRRIDKLLRQHCIVLKEGKKKKGEAHFRSIYGSMRFEDKKQAALTLELITVRQLESSQRSVSHLNRELSLLRAIFRYARRSRLIARVPFEEGESLISVAAENRRDRILSVDEEDRLLKAARNSRAGHLYYFIISAIETAGRSGELLRLRWSEIDFEKGLLGFVSYKGKKRTERRVGLTSRLKAALMEWLMISEGTSEDFVFGGMKSVRHGFDNACEAAGIEDLNIHDLRHTATTRMIAAGIPPVKVMKITGHTQWATFERYVNLDDQLVKETAERLDAIRNSERIGLESDSGSDSDRKMVH